MRWDCASPWRQLGRLPVLPLLLLAELAWQLGATVRQALRPAGGKRRGGRGPTVRSAAQTSRSAEGSPTRATQPRTRLGRTWR
jgi:hypothetical protein